MIEKTKKFITLDNIINFVCLIVIFAGIGTSIYMLYVNRSLWIDEGAFAYSFSKRNLINLTFGAFEWNQIAPIIYLYIVKLITVIFGNTEVTLRIFSLISYIGILYLSYLCSKKIFEMKYPLMPSAYIASMTLILKYSNEFKVYIFDSVCVLLV